MKITAGKREDILRQRDEWDAENQRREARRKEQSKNYRLAMYNVLEPVQNEIMSYLEQYTLLNFEVNAESDYHNDKVRVNIRCNEFNKFDEGNALSWNFDVRLDKEGNVLKESGSWSGLKACTEEQLASLQQSVDALVTLNGIDWAMVLDKALPDADEFFTRDPNEQPLGQRPNFKEQLIEAAISECVGQNILIEGVAGDGSGYRGGARVYYLVRSESPKQYVVSEVVKSWVDTWMSRDNKPLKTIIAEVKGYYTYRVTKAKFVNLVTSDKDGNITTLSQ